MLEDAIQKAERRACDLAGDLKTIIGLTDGTTYTPAQRALRIHLQELLDEAADIRDSLRRLWA